MNYKYCLPSSKNPSKKTYPFLKQIFHYRIFVIACAILDSNLDTVPIYCFIQLWIFFSIVHCYMCLSNFPISVFDFSLSLRFSASLRLISLSHKLLYLSFVWNFSETFLLSPLSTIYYVAKESKANRPFSITTATVTGSQPFNRKTLYKISHTKTFQSVNAIGITTFWPNPRASCEQAAQYISVPTLVFDIHW